MKRFFPLVLVSIALSVIIARLVVSGRFDAIRVRVEESYEAMTQGCTPVEGGPVKGEVAA